MVPTRKQLLLLLAFRRIFCIGCQTLGESGHQWQPEGQIPICGLRKRTYNPATMKGSQISYVQDHKGPQGTKSRRQMRYSGL